MQSWRGPAWRPPGKIRLHRLTRNALRGQPGAPGPSRAQPRPDPEPQGGPPRSAEPRPAPLAASSQAGPARSISWPSVKPAQPGHAVQQSYPVRPKGLRRAEPSGLPAVPSEGAPREVGEQGMLYLEGPVLLKGPLRIPLPEFLQSRDGHFLLTLRCRVDVDGSSTIQVMESCGAPDLDEAVRQSFSGLPWYRGELAGRPVALTVRLVIEGQWQAGEGWIDWGGRVPGSQGLEMPQSGKFESS